MTFEPVRGGTRGGQAEFKWSDVSQDKDRENYLGHSINAPTGRWQKNKDIHWYNRDIKAEEAERLEEIRKIKEAEAEALAAALGFGSTKPGAVVSGSNAVPVPTTEGAKEKTETAEEKEERRRMRKAEKRAKREEKRAGRRVQSSDSGRRRDPRTRSRSRSPVRRREEHYRWHPTSRSRSPVHRRDFERPRTRDRR